MKRSDLAARLAEKENLSYQQADAVIRLVIQSFKDALAKGDRIEIRGFGSFVMRQYKTYTGRNPRSGKKVDVDPKRLPYFKVGKELRGKINGQSVMDEGIRE
jgi:integration host factor subunit beta